MSHTCKECGNEETGKWTHTPELVRLEQCFGCHFWMEKVGWEIEGNKDIVRVNGTHYYIKPDPTGQDARPHLNHCLGHAGRKFVIQFHDGRKVESINVWCQGDIPKSFRSRLPDNAVFA